MDFVPFTYTPEQKRRNRIRFFGAVALSSGLMSVLPVFLLAGVSIAELSATAFCVAAGASMGGAVAGVITSTIPSEMRMEWKRKRAEALRVSVGRHYGLELTAAEFAALNYPLNAPSKSFRVYGSILKGIQVSDSEFVERKISLVSMEGELQLSSSKDGKRFKELPQARPELPAAPAQAQSALVGISAHSSISA